MLIISYSSTTVLPAIHIAGKIAASGPVKIKSFSKLHLKASLRVAPETNTGRSHIEATALIIHLLS